MEIHARTILPLLAVMLIPTIAVFFGIKKPLLKRETRNYQRRNQALREAFITGSEQLRSNEYIVDINDLENLYSNEWRFLYGDTQGMWHS